MTEDDGAPLARGSAIPADVAAVLARPVGKSRERHARETTARVARRVELSRATGERLNYIGRYAPDLQVFIGDEGLSIYAAYKLARQRREAAMPDAELRTAGALNRAARALERFRKHFIRDYGQLDAASTALALVNDAATEMHRAANAAAIQWYRQRPDDAE